jgi:hypothetical protein
LLPGSMLQTKHYLSNDTTLLSLANWRSPQIEPEACMLSAASQNVADSGEDVYTNCCGRVCQFGDIGHRGLVTSPTGFSLKYAVSYRPLSSVSEERD